LPITGNFNAPEIVCGPLGELTELPRLPNCIPGEGEEGDWEGRTPMID